MPMILVDDGVTCLVQKVCGSEKLRRHMESLGFVEGTEISILSRFSEYFIVLVKGSKIGLDKETAKHIIVSVR